MSFENEFYGPNLGYILELYEQYRKDPNAVDEVTRKLFEGWSPAEPGTPVTTTQNLLSLSGAANLAQAIRVYGYLSANLNPLDNTSKDNSLLTPEFHHLNEEDLFNLPADIVKLPKGLSKGNAHEAIEVLRSIYGGTIGYDYGHIRITEERDWLYQAAETGRFRPPTQPVDGRKLLERLTQVEAFELFLNRLYPGKTRFSIEGLDILIPMLDEIIANASLENICVPIIGMAHRGRLNVLAHVLQKPYSQILAEFADPKGRATTWDELGWTGDVKYHIGAYRSPAKDQKMDMLIHMPANPSHLEMVDPVITGMARAANTKVDVPGAPRYFHNASLPIMIHGDASFSGQGIVAETFNFSRVPGYGVSGTLHIIANNQLGFTATEGESRSSMFASDLAEGFEIPIIHVNADDPIACIEAARTALAYRQKFRKDFMIDLIGYRRYGHNEGDEPRFTQPVMYKVIDEHPRVRQIWAERLETEGTLQQAEANELLQANLKTLQDANDQLDPVKALDEPVPKPPPRGAAQKVKTAVTIKRLKELEGIMRCVDSCAITNNLWGVRWSKLCVNGMRNALSAVTGMSGNERDAHDQVRRVGIRLGSEAVRVGQALGYQLESMARIPAARFGEAPDNPAAMAEIEEALVRGTKSSARSNDQRPSMAQDIQKGRRTEIDFLNGLIVEKGSQLGVPTPTHEHLVTATRQVERGQLQPRPEIVLGW